MSDFPTFQRHRLVYDEFLSRCDGLGIIAWFCGESGQVIVRPKSITNHDPSLVAEIEAAFPAIAAAGYAEQTPVALRRGAWAIPLPFGPLGSGTGLIIAIILDPRPEAAAREMTSLLSWSFKDLCKSVQDSETLGQLGDKLTQAYEEVNLLCRIAQLLNSVNEPEKVLATACAEMRAVLPIGWLAVKFSSEARGVPSLQGHFLLAGGESLDAQDLAHKADVLLAKADTDEWTRVLTPAKSEVAAAMHSEVLAELITQEDRVLGMLVAGGKHLNDADFASGEMQCLHAAAHFLGLYHGNVTRFTEQRAMFLGTLKAMISAVDAKDPYTCGHSERVALLARKLSRAVGMSEPDVETYHFAGLVHDVGKIGVPEAVLCKSGKLDDAEFAWIKRHPEIGHRILKDIPAMQVVLPGVLHHHERWDGNGYPHRLAGEQIPFMARVLAVADTFDAMSSNRSYRSALPRERIVAELRRCAGAQFDPALVEPFLTLDLADFDAMLSSAAVKAAA